MDTNRANDITTDDQSEYVMEIQRILRDLSFWLDGNPAVAVDGNYDDGTRAAVSEFQTRYGLPVTGNVDSRTLRMLHEMHKLYGNYYNPPLCISIYPNMPGYQIEPGEISTLVTVLQIVLTEMCSIYDTLCGVEINGVFDEPTVASVKKYQEAAGLPVTGNVDRLTWNRLAAEFNALLRTKHTE